jgi:hypothetical protein
MLGAVVAALTSCNARSASNIPPLETFPDKAETGRAELRMIERTWLAVKSGRCDITSAATPLTIGAANEVPSRY